MTLNWTKIRNEYINGHISYRKLAEKHGISFNTLKDRAVAEKWFDKKKEQHNRIEIKTQQKTAEKIAEQESDLAANIHSAATKLLEKINIAIEQTDLFIERTKKRLPKKVIDKQTGETITAWVEDENIRLTQKDGINVDSVIKLTNAIKTMQSIQLAGKEIVQQEAPSINITVKAATPADMEVDED